MTPIQRHLLAFAVSLVRSRLSLQVEIVALRHQVTLYQRSTRRPWCVRQGAGRGGDTVEWKL